MPGPCRGAIGCCVRAGLSAGLASRGGEIGRNLRLEDRTGEATGRILEDGEIEVLRLVRLAASLVEARQGQPRVAAERTIDGGGLPVCVAGSRGVPRRPAGGGKAHERLLAKVVPRGRCGEELAISRGGRGGIGLPGERGPLVEGGETAVAGARIVAAERGERLGGLGPAAGLEVVVGGLEADGGGGLLAAPVPAHGRCHGGDPAGGGGDGGGRGPGC